MDEVQKKAQEIRASQTPSPPPWRQSSIGRVRELETRNKQLSELLATAVSELWECQRSIVEDDNQVKDERNVEKLSAAIAKVQYIQVYLEQPSLQLAESPLRVSKQRDNTNVTKVSGFQDDARTGAGSTGLVSQQLQGEGEAQEVSTSNIVAVSSMKAPPDLSEDSHTGVSSKGAEHSLPAEQTPGTTKVKTHQLRPSLEQGSFSFMLGQDNETRASTPPSRPNSSLFGGHDTTPGRASSRAGSRNVTLDDNEFDIGSLKRAKGDRK